MCFNIEQMFFFSISIHYVFDASGAYDNNSVILGKPICRDNKLLSLRLKQIGR